MSEEQKQSDLTRRFENDEIQAEFIDEGSCRYSLKISLAPSWLQKQRQKAVKEISKHVSLPGFRKGRAPISLLETRFGAEIHREFRKIALEESFHEAISLAHIQPLHDRAVSKANIQSLELDQPSVAEFIFEAYPQPPAISIDTLVLSDPEPLPPSADEVEGFIERMREFHAKWEPIEGRPVAESDWVVVDVDTVGDTVVNVMRERLISLSSVDDSIPSWLKELVVGLNVGDSTEYQETVDDSSSTTPTRYRISLRSIQNRLLPDVDESFSQKTFNSSLDALKEKASSILFQQTKQSMRESALTSIANQLLEQYPISLPKSLLEGEIRAKIKVREYYLKEAGRSVSSTTREPTREEVAQAVEEQLRLYFLLRPFAADRKVTISRQDLLDTLDHQERLPLEQRWISPEMDANLLRERLTRFVIIGKSLELIRQELQK